MKKSIGTKVFIMLLTLTVIFVAAMQLNLTRLRSIGKINSQISTTYLMLEDNHEQITSSFLRLQLFGNVSYMWEGTEEGEIVKGNLMTAVDDLRNAVAEMESGCNDIGDTELSRYFDAWKKETLEFADFGEEMYQAAVSGNVTKVEEMVNQIKDKRTAFDETGAAYDAVFNEKISATSQSSIEQISSAQVLTHILMAVFGIIFVVVMFVIMKTIALPARKSGKVLDEIMEKLENDEGDLTLRVPVATSDEVGQMAKGINSFVEKLQLLIHTLKEQDEELMLSAEKMADEINDSNEKVNNISATMEQMSANMQEIAVTIGQIAEGSDSVLQEVQNINGSVKEGVELVQEIKKRAECMYQNTIDGKYTTSNKILEIRGMLNEALEESRSVEQIKQLTSEILKITKQTNLLSLNASIEAARAGEAGKGFAVVASQIMALADNSAYTANNIQNISNQVIGAVEKLAENAEKMLEFVDMKILKDYDDFVVIVEKYEQDADSINTLIENFSQNTGEIHNTISVMTTGLNNISIAVDDSAKGVTNMAESTVSLVSVMEQIQQQTIDNQKISKQLSSEVRRFKNV